MRDGKSQIIDDCQWMTKDFHSNPECPNSAIPNEMRKILHSVCSLNTCLFALNLEWKLMEIP
jgi:hypothetical protein